MTRNLKLATILWMATGLLLIIGLTVSPPLRADDEAQPDKLLKSAQDVFQPIPDAMPGSENDTPVRIRLGKKLYFETCISINKTQSCNSCHRLDEGLAGVDGLPTSKGALGEFGGRNAPTTLNAGFHIAQFWDGRAPDLAAQAKGPVLAGVEMGMPDEAAVLARLKEADYEKLFKKAFPEADQPLTYDNYAEAVAAFERTLVTHDRFDDYLGGDLSALPKSAQRGLELFIDIGCAECHQGALLGGDRYEKMGEVNPYPNQKDLGRFDVTKKEEDKYVFKVPSLRNIALTGPYFHDGKSATLEDAVQQMGHLQLDEKLDDKQVRDIVAFLKSLSRKRGGKKKDKPAEQ